MSGTAPHKHRLLTDAGDAYRVVSLGDDAARIVCGNETVEIVRSRRAAAYHARQLARGAEYVDRHRPIGARILPVDGPASGHASPNGTFAPLIRDIGSLQSTTTGP
jgi:hypothetical protein